MDIEFVRDGNNPRWVRDYEEVRFNVLVDGDHWLMRIKRGDAVEGFDLKGTGDRSIPDRILSACRRHQAALETVGRAALQRGVFAKDPKLDGECAGHILLNAEEVRGCLPK